MTNKTTRVTTKPNQNIIMVMSEVSKQRMKIAEAVYKNADD